MPASKKPRKKRQYKVTMKGLEYWARFTTRGEGWSESMLGRLCPGLPAPSGRHLLEQREGSLHEKAFWENQGSARHGVGAWESSHRAG